LPEFKAKRNAGCIVSGFGSEEFGGTMSDRLLMQVVEVRLSFSMILREIILLKIPDLLQKSTSQSESIRQLNALRRRH
jgi:hypothetical protein